MKDFFLRFWYASPFIFSLIWILYSSWKDVQKKRREQEFQEELDLLEVEEFRAFADWSIYMDEHEGYELIKYDVKQKELFSAYCESKLAIYELKHELDANHSKRFVFDLIEFMEMCPDEDHQQRVMNLLFS